jgi:hypothetical protein
MMKIIFAFVLTFTLFSENSDQKNFGDKILPFVKLVSQKLKSFERPQDFERALTLNMRIAKVQRQFEENFPFFCDVRRSHTFPISVHKLRPGDIDIVAAIGDSLTVASGAMAFDVIHALVEQQGVSWSIGGEGNWRRFLTIPNILKKFNPQLYGFSLNKKGYSGFNVGEIGVSEIMVVTF